MCLFFIQKTFCDLFFFLGGGGGGLGGGGERFVCVLYCCLGMVKEKRGRRGGQGEDTWSIKFDNVHIQQY